MNEFEIGKEIAQLSARLAALESRVHPQMSIVGEALAEIPSSDTLFLGDEFAFEHVRAVAPGSCPASFNANWQNKKVKTKVCASNADEAGANASDEIETAVKKLVRDAAGLDCAARSGCAAPTTCKEKWNRLTAQQLGNWSCRDTDGRGDCEDGQTTWECTGWFNIKATLKCKCSR